MKLKNFTKSFVFAIILTISFLTNISAQKIKDLIEPVNLIAGRMDSTLISDMFYANDYAGITLDHNPAIKAKFNFDKSKLIFNPPPDTEGLFLVGFSFYKNHYVIPVRVIQQQMVKFKFKPEKKYAKVFLFGSFNSWNRSDLQMKESNGEYEITIPLEPGRYQYKFFADGAELVDPENSDKIPNGMGDYNSVLTINPKHKSQPFLHILGSECSKDESEFSFVYENHDTNKKISEHNLIALLNNNSITLKHVKISGDTIDISLPSSELEGKNTLRVAVTQEDQSTNIQNVV
ncbi:MAG: isoamylase early set domain-containing protein, partial [Candidatus Lokiarchaeia archaeon]|nr:isoamylase early set domain-containing protein [Candidatus Lokiarchaeia archaeon]